MFEAWWWIMPLSGGVLVIAGVMPFLMILLSRRSVRPQNHPQSDCGMTLELGCGKKPTRGVDIHVDLRQLPHVELVCDLNDGLPFVDDAFDSVLAFDLIEHLDEPLRFVEEIWRILKDDGKLFIRTAWYLSPLAWRDITHKHLFGLGSFDLFDPNTRFGKDYGFSSVAKFRIKKKRFVDSCMNIYLEMEAMKDGCP